MAWAIAQLGSSDDDEFMDKLDGRSRILRAVRRGNIAYLRAMFVLWPPLRETRGHMGRRPLHIAADSGNVKMLKFLVATGANVNGRRDREDTPLFWSKSGEIAEILLEAGANLHARDFSNREPIHWAAQFKRPDVIQVFLRHGSDPNLRSGDRRTPLHWAVTEIINPEPHTCVSELLAAGAEVNVQDDLGRTPLDYAKFLPNLEQKLFNGELKYNPDTHDAVKRIIHLLMQHGANPKLRSVYGECALELACETVREIIEQYV